MAEHVLIVEDDLLVRSFEEEYLGANGYKVFVTEYGESMFQILAEQPVDLIILDIMLPSDDGFDLAKRIRSSSNIPIIMVTAKDDSVDRIVGLEVGADDYVVKPFDARDLLARVRAVLRRARWSSAPGPGKEIGHRAVAHFAGWELNLKRMQLTSSRGDDIKLTAAEFNLLSVLIGHSGQVHSRDQLIDLIYGRGMFPFERTIDTLISRLRRKIEKDHRSPNLIKTIHRAGYLFTPEVEWE